MERTLKIVEQGDFFKKKTYPQITLQGQWLRKAGFSPNQHVKITQNEQGQLVLTPDPHKSM